MRMGWASCTGRYALSVSQVLGAYPTSDSAQFARSRLERFLVNLSQVQSQSGDDAAWFLALPDFSPSLNRNRVRVGIPVGGLLGWADPTIVPATLPVNGCGMAVAKLKSSIADTDMPTRIQAFLASKPSIDDIPVEWDAGRKNHFLSIYEDAQGESFAILHCSLPELKAESRSGLQSTSAGSNPLEFYCGRYAERFFANAVRIQDLAVRKRRLICERVFPGCEVISNRNHVSFIAPGLAAIGCYVSRGPLKNSPFTVGPTRDAYLLDVHIRTETPVGDFYVQPHGTGNSMRLPGKVQYQDESDSFRIERDSVTFASSPSQVFDSWPTLETVRQYFDPWLTQATRTLSPRIETKLVLTS